MPNIQNDVQISLYQIGGTPVCGATATWTFHSYLKPIYMQWCDFRLGGNAWFDLYVEDTFTENVRNQSARQEWEIHVGVKLTDESVFTTWYRGLIERSAEVRVGGSIYTHFMGNGYSYKYMARGYHWRDSTTETISTILQKIFDTSPNLVSNSRCLWDASKLSMASEYTVNAWNFKGDSLHAVQFLSILQGGTGVLSPMEWKIDPTDRKFYFQDPTNTVTEGSLFIAGKDITDVAESGMSGDGGNQLIGFGIDRGGDVYYRLWQNAGDIASEGIRSELLDITPLSNDTDADRYLQSHYMVTHWTTSNLLTFMWPEVTWWLHKYIPIGKIRVHLPESDEAARQETFQLHKVIYEFGQIPSVEKNEIKQESSWIKAQVFLGNQGFGLMEEIVRISDRQYWSGMRNWNRNRTYPLAYSSDPAAGDFPGQMIHNTTTHLNKYWDDNAGAWVTPAP